MCLLAPRLVAVPPSISNIRSRENSKQNHKASCSKPGKSKNATENANAKNNGTENAQKMQLPTLHFLRCIFLQLATLHFLRCIFFATLINSCIFLTEKKRKKSKNKCNDTKTNATENAKKMQLPTLHFLSFILFATCDVAFS